MTQSISLILLMGGKGRRFSSTVPKQFQYLSGKKIYLHTIEIFYKLNIFEKIILPCPKDYIEMVKEETKEYKNIYHFLSSSF